MGAAMCASLGLAFAQVGEEGEDLPTSQADQVEPTDRGAALTNALQGSAEELSALFRVPQQNPHEDLETYIDGLMDAYQATYRAPGYIVSVVSADDVLLSKGYGLADVEEGIAVSPEDTRWHVASISKTFVWTSVMMLAERGVLDLDADVNTYLKTFKMPEGKKPLTLNHIMAHRSGLEDVYDLFSVEVQDLPMAEAMAATQPKQVYERGTIRAYSNWATNLAALVIEDTTGSYADFLLSEVLAPIGMTGSTLGTTGEAYEQLKATKNYSVTPWGPEDDEQFDSNVFASLGGMTITGKDMGTWMRFHLGEGEVDGVRLMSRETYAEMRQRVYGEDSAGADMAHGMSDRFFRGMKVFGHSGSINSVYSDFTIAPELNLGVFIAQNSHATYTPISQLSSLLMDRQMAFIGLEQEGVRDDAPTGDDAVAAAEELAGRYISSRMPYTDYEKMFGLFSSTNVSAKDGAIIFGSGQGGSYQPVAKDTWENHLGARITAARNDAGELIGIYDSFGASMLLPMTWQRDDRIFLAGLAGAAGLLMTTLLGLWRRLGRRDKVSTSGRLLSLVPLISIAPFGWFAYSMSKMSELQNLSFAKIFSQGYPPPLATTIAQSGSLLAVTGILMVLTLWPAWNGSRWSIWRKMHHTALATAFGVLTFGLFQWDIAFNSLTFG